jgi:hypothetical protein
MKLKALERERLAVSPEPCQSASSPNTQFGEVCQLYPIWPPPITPFGVRVSEPTKAGVLTGITAVVWIVTGSVFRLLAARPQL